MAAKPRKEIDTSTYSGRVAARLASLMVKRQLTPEGLQKALAKHGESVSISGVYAYLNKSRTIPPDLYPALAAALGCKNVRDFLPAE